MYEHTKERGIAVVGIDLAKRSFHVYGVDEQGREVLSKKLTRARPSLMLANLPACTVAM